jgi:membrane associated rhomboid family serine protease
VLIHIPKKIAYERREKQKKPDLKHLKDLCYFKHEPVLHIGFIVEPVIRLCGYMFPLYDENKNKTRPIVTWALIIVNGLVFFWVFSKRFDYRIFLTFGEIPALVMQGKQLHTLVTSMFLHGDFWHILGNMVFLFIFGDNIEDRFGHIKYLLLYFIFGIGGGLAHSSVAVMYGGYDAYIPAIGASAAISGILGAYLVFFPRAKIVSVVPSFIFIRVAPIPAWVFIGFWFILQLLYSGGATSVAYMAHIGGFLTGLTVAATVRLKSQTRTKVTRSSNLSTPRFMTTQCNNCGKRVPYNALFCPNCGSKCVR